MSAANDIMSNYQHVVETISLTPGEKGVFNVTVNDEVLYSKHDVGRHAEPGEVLNLFAEAYAQGVPVYQ